MRLSWAGKLFFAGVAAKAAGLGLKALAARMRESDQTIMLSAEQINAASAYAQNQGISLNEAVFILYNVNLVE